MLQTDSSTRVQPISPPYPEGVDEALNQASPRWRRSGPLTLFRVWARHPKLGGVLGHVGNFLLNQGEVEAADRELGHPSHLCEGGCGV